MTALLPERIMCAGGIAPPHPPRALGAFRPGSPAFFYTIG